MVLGAVQIFLSRSWISLSHCHICVVKFMAEIYPLSWKVRGKVKLTWCYRRHAPLPRVPCQGVPRHPLQVDGVSQISQIFHKTFYLSVSSVFIFSLKEGIQPPFAPQPRRPPLGCRSEGHHRGLQHHHLRHHVHPEGPPGTGGSCSSMNKDLRRRKG